MSEIQVTDATFNDIVVKSDKPVLVDFWAPWCGPCRMLGPVVEEIANEYNGKAVVCKLNTDDNPNTAANFRISAIPTILIFKGGKVAAQLVGLQSKAELKKQLDALL